MKSLSSTGYDVAAPMLPLKDVADGSEQPVLLRLTADVEAGALLSPATPFSAVSLVCTTCVRFDDVDVSTSERSLWCMSRKNTFPISAIVQLLTT